MTHDLIGNLSSVIGDEYSDDASLCIESTLLEFVNESPSGKYIFYPDRTSNQTQTYNGADIEIGVIKNNEWIIPLSTDWPFIDESTGLIRSSADIYHASEGKYFSYIGNGCFYYFWEDYVINVNTKQSCEMPSGPVRIIAQPDEEVIYHEANDGKLLLTSGEIFDTNTMTSSHVVFPHEDKLDSNTNYTKIHRVYPKAVVFPYSDGLYAVVGYKDEYTDDDVFYNAQGERVIDLRQYHLISTTFLGIGRNSAYEDKATQGIIFNDGYATFKVANDAGAVFEITIDKSGTVTNSVDLGYYVSVY